MAARRAVKARPTVAYTRYVPSVRLTFTRVLVVWVVVLAALLWLERAFL